MSRQYFHVKMLAKTLAKAEILTEKSLDTLKPSQARALQRKCD
jgi:hypothetical protein